MNKIKKFFNIRTSYKFEWNDLRAFMTLLNVIAIMIFGLPASWFGLAIAACGLIRDFTTDRHINGIVMHLTTICLNIYFISII